MEFSNFLNQVSKVKKIALDGEKAHLEMLSGDRKPLKINEIEKRNPLKAGVMALFYPNQAHETMLILILRKTYKGVHSGQIGFPGGKKENVDHSMQDTALRETYEEIGVRPSSISVCRQLTKVYIPPSNFWVYPFLGITEVHPKFKRQESEVEELLPVKVEDILDDSKIVTRKFPTPSGKEFEAPGFLFDDKVVWGATGMMLNEVKVLLQHIL